MNPEFPVYIISKGRWESRKTSKALESMRVPYRIVVEPQEYDHYANVIHPSKILILPFSNLGQGSIPARNLVWEHAIQEGYAYHWILDDNIRAFYRYNNNDKIYMLDGSCFYIIERFILRYKNLAQAGMQYELLSPRKYKHKNPITWNTRIYSCILLKNDLPFRWRGRYNEDTDLSLRFLKAGFCTALFYAFLAQKISTMTMKGGNTDELYKGDGRLKMAQSLVAQHPDVTKITYKWGRYQHHVDYRPFRNNRPILKDGIVLSQTTDEYGLQIVKNEQVGKKAR